LPVKRRKIRGVRLTHCQKRSPLRVTSPTWK
jgi:hypothetical protein